MIRTPFCFVRTAYSGVHAGVTRETNAQTIKALNNTLIQFSVWRCLLGIFIFFGFGNSRKFSVWNFQFESNLCVVAKKPY